MKSVMLVVAILIVVFAFGYDSVLAQTPSRVAVEGTVVSEVDSSPIPFVTVRVPGTGLSTLTSETGQYRVLLPSGSWEIKFTHVAFYSDTVRVDLGEGDVVRDIVLRPAPVMLGDITVFEKTYDPGQKIILEAIARKRDILERIRDYSYDAYTKFIVRDLSAEDPVESIFLIAESQTSAYWQYPDKYKEIITARKQSSNIPAEGNLVSVGEILNFNKNRIDLGKYSVVSPTATDALSHYDYYLVDTVYLDGRAVFRLEIEPKSDSDPLFRGTIDIADSTFDVVAVDVGFNEAVRFEMLDSLRYSQRFAQFDNEYFMPIAIRFEGQLHLGVKLPIIPQHIGFAQSASLYSYQFDQGVKKGIFNEYLIEVVDEADDYDSTAWDARQTVPLTTTETDAYVRIDSVVNAPKPLGKTLLRGTLAVLALTVFGGEEMYDIFHFNRVDGAYVGLGGTIRSLSPDWRLRVKSGYAFGREKWQHHYGFQYRVSRSQRLWLGASYKDEIVKRPTIIAAQGYNPTFLALLAQMDPFDYYREKGFALSASGKVVNHVDLSLGYKDYDQTTVDTTTRYSLNGKDSDSFRPNPTIADGKLRAITAELAYDSRPLFRNKRRDMRAGGVVYTTLAIGAEYASPDFIDNDFDYRQYWVRAKRRQRTFGLGITTLEAFASSSDGDLPPQRYFAVDHGNGEFYAARNFGTLEPYNFYGSRTAMVYLFHDFDQLLFRKSRIPLIEDIPLTLSVFGGAFWSDFKGKTTFPGDEFLLTAEKPYIEAGFGIGNLTPFISPFNLAVFFSWQISDYDTDGFSWDIGIQL